MPRRTITIPKDVDLILEKVDNVSGYIANAIAERWQAWQEALLAVRAAGLSNRSLKAIFDACNGLFMTPGMDVGAQLQANLADFERLTGGATKKWKVPQEELEATLEQLGTPVVAQAVWTLHKEFWTHNLELDLKLELF